MSGGRMSDRERIDASLRVIRGLMTELDELRDELALVTAERDAALGLWDSVVSLVRSEETARAVEDGDRDV